MRSAGFVLLALTAVGSVRATAQVFGPAAPRCAATEGIEAPASLLDSIRFLVSQRDSVIRSEPVPVPRWRQTGAVVDVQVPLVPDPELYGSLQVWWQPGWWRNTTFPEGPPLAALWLDDSIVHNLGPAAIVFVDSYNGSVVDWVEFPVSAPVLSALARAHSAFVRLARRPSPEPRPDSVTRVDIQRSDLRAMAALFAAAACGQIGRVPRRERSN